MGLWGTSLGEESLLGNVQRSMRGARTHLFREEAGWAVVPAGPRGYRATVPASHTCLQAQHWEARGRKSEVQSDCSRLEQGHT